MALKSTSTPSNYPFLRAVKHFYRTVGWIGVCLTLILSTIGAIDVLGRMMPETLFTYRLLGAFLIFLGFLTIGLFLSGLAFLVSTCIDAAMHTMENGHVQTELLRRLVREQSDNDAVFHKMETHRPQTEILHRLEHDQSSVQSS